MFWENRMRNKLIIIAVTLACLIMGYSSSLFQVESLLTWYPYLDKAPLTPPNIAFPIAWTILYIMMGISVGLIMTSNSPKRFICIKIFIAQFVLNLLWSIFFFYAQNPLMGFIDILLLDLLVIIYIVECAKPFKFSCYLFIPYLLWILFATYLNGYILLNN